MAPFPTLGDYDRSFMDGTVNIHVGRNPTKTFQVYKHMLTVGSSFFRAAFDGGFAEADSRALNLVDEDPGVFLVILQGLHTGRIRINDLPETKSKFAFLVQLYVALDGYCIASLKDIVMRRLLRYPFLYSAETLPNSLIFAYNRTTSGSLLRKFLSELVAFCCVLDPEELRKYELAFEQCTEFTMDVSRLWVTKGTGMTGPTKGDWSRFYEEGREEGE